MENKVKLRLPVSDLPAMVCGVDERTFPIFGRKLAEARKRVGLSQEDLGGIIGRSLSGVYRIERQDVAHVFHRVRPKLVAALKMTDEEFEREVEAKQPGAEFSLASPAFQKHFQALKDLTSEIRRRDKAGQPIDDRQVRETLTRAIERVLSAMDADATPAVLQGGEELPSSEATGSRERGSNRPNESETMRAAEEIEQAMNERAAKLAQSDARKKPPRKSPRGRGRQS